MPFGGGVRLRNSAQLDLNGFDHTFMAINPGVGSVRLAGASLTLIGGGSIDEGVIGPGAIAVQLSGLILRGLCSQTSTTVGTTDLTSVTPSVTIDSAAALGVSGAPITLINGAQISTFMRSDPIVIDATHNVVLQRGGGFAPNGELRVEGVVSGFGSLFVRGSSGSVALRNPSNSFTGTIVVDGDGTLRVRHNDVLGAGSNVIHLGSAFFDGESWRVSGGTLQAETNITLPATRRIELEGTSQETGNNRLDSQEFTVTIDGDITESKAGGGLVKMGSGTLLLNGLNSITDELVVQEGTLGGTGTVQNVRLQSHTTLAPGHRIGTFHAANVRWPEDATMAFELGEGAFSDRLELSGALTGDTDTARLFVFSGAPVLATYTLITGAGGGNLSTDFEVNDFTFTGPVGLAGTFSLDNTALKFTVTRLPSGGGDSDGDGLPDDWEITHFGGLAQTAEGDPDGDGQSNALEYAAGTDPDRSASRFTFELLSIEIGGTTLRFAPSQTNRIYVLEARKDFTSAIWQVVSNARFTPKNGGQWVVDSNVVSTQTFYRLQINTDP